MGYLRFDNLPTSLFCHWLDNVHWKESQRLLMEVQSVSRWTPALWLTLPSSEYCVVFLDAGLNATVDNIKTLTNLIGANVISNIKGTV